MYGEPEDVKGECNARLYIADDFGDNHATMRCQLPEGHDGLHKEEFNHDSPVVITWQRDERIDDRFEKELSKFHELNCEPCLEICNDENLLASCENCEKLKKFEEEHKDELD